LSEKSRAPQIYLFRRFQFHNVSTRQADAVSKMDGAGGFEISEGGKGPKEWLLNGGFCGTVCEMFNEG
jgi:hypothetical protein